MEEIENNNLNIQKKVGGARKGAGRPVGSTTKPKISDYLTLEEVKGLVDVAKAEALQGKPDMLKFMLEQVFGKAPQSNLNVNVESASLNEQQKELINKSLNDIL